MNLTEFLVALVINGGGGGGLTYLVARWIFMELPQWDINPSRKQKRALVYLISLALPTLGLTLSAALNVLPLTPDALFSAFTTAFLVSQILHGTLDLAGASVDLPKGKLRIDAPKR